MNNSIIPTENCNTALGYHDQEKKERRIKRQDRFVLGGSLTELLLVNAIEKTSNLKMSLVIYWCSRSLHMYL